MRSRRPRLGRVASTSARTAPAYWNWSLDRLHHRYLLTAILANTKRPPSQKGRRRKERSAVPPLLDPAQADPTLPRDGRSRQGSRVSLNGGVSVVAYSVLRPFGTRLTDPFGATAVRACTIPGSLRPRLRRLLAPFDVDTLFACWPNVAAGAATVNKWRAAGMRGGSENQLRVSDRY